MNKHWSYVCGLITGASIAGLVAMRGPQIITWLLYPECRGAPAAVEYRPGMTLCPGQSFVIKMELFENSRKDPNI